VQQRLQPATTSISTTLCHDQQSSVAQASFRMCYQVVERFSSCRCLYYKHAIDPCAAHGQEAHVIEEKTVLVGYACPSHWECEVSGPVQVPYASLTLGNVGLEDTRPAQVPRESPRFGHRQLGDARPPPVSYDSSEFEFDNYDSSDDTESNCSASSSALMLRSTTSFVSVSEETIQDILQMLLEDPLLRWEQLNGQKDRHNDNNPAIRDVRFFLETFEMDLRASALTTLERQTCSFFRSRTRYLSSQICKRFNLVENQNDTIYGISKDLAIVAADEDGSAFMPTFSKIQHFLFAGDPFQGLKVNVRNCTQNSRDYICEMVDIITKNMHPPAPAFASAWEFEKYRLHPHLDMFLLALAADADLWNLSASDRTGIKSLQNKVNEMSARLRAFWLQKLPVWHFYPLIIKSDKFTASVLLMETNSSYETFEAFTSSSSALLDLARNLSSNGQNTLKGRSPINPSTPIKIVPISSPCTAKISYQCVSIS
jgi:hypothetical protein